MNTETPLKANAQFAEGGKPGGLVLDHPAMPFQPFLALYSAPGNARRDPSLFQGLPAAGKVVALVRMQFVQAFARLAFQARRCRHRINRGPEGHRIMPVGTSDRDCQGNAPGIYNQVSLASELATIRWIWLGFLAHRGLGTLAVSKFGRLQSIGSCSCNRRQHVMLLPKPSSCGRSSQAVPVRRTYWMPFNAARSSIAPRRPPLGNGVNTGNNDSSASHNSLLVFVLPCHPDITCTVGCLGCVGGSRDTE